MVKFMMKNISRVFKSVCFVMFFVLCISISNIFASTNILKVSSKSINIYEKFDIKSIQEDTNAIYRYSSSDSLIASVDSDGFVTGNKMGQAVITITDENGNAQSLDLSVGFYRGLDVSTFNGNVDYAKLKSKGIDFVMIRSSFGWYDQNDAAKGKEYNFQYDAQLYNNIKGASDYGIPFGIYHYSYARNTTEATLEAEYTINALKSTGAYASNMSLPIAYDVEDNEYQGSLDISTLTDIVITYCTKIREAGYSPMIYANKNWFVNHLDVERLNSLGYDFWYAFWPNNPDFSSKIQIANSGIYPLIWQYTSSGNIEGANISSGSVDLNIMYMKEQVKLTFVSESEILEERGIDKGTSISSFPEVSKNGYTFVKWIDQNGNEVTTNTKFDSNTILTAVFEKKTIKLSSNRVFLLKNMQTKITAKYNNNTSILSEDLIYKSLNEDIATVDESGNILAKNIGNTKIEVYLKEDNTVVSTCDVIVADDYEKGDINKDGIIDVADVTYGMHRLSRGTLTEDEENIGNVNGDDIFDVADVLKIMRYLSGKINSLN